MILADTNFWLAISLSKHQFHRAARRWFDEQRAAQSVLFCRLTQLSFLRLITTDGVMRLYDIPPLTNEAAWEFYKELLVDRRCALANEPSAVESRWRQYAQRDSSSPKLWMDAYLAAFAVAGGHKLVTTDKAFTQFKDLEAIILARS